ncbi:hypothetical protein [Breoghania sp.]|uniref:hypothetical protein n=1 Tax=Breoghania sp. TaxID=2065378 RepID=UPI00261C92DE|nr:hypothetical protein [Breoghania sp.]MDJ0930382.1 hypothetical protein [Breoghania sp.]
MAKAHEHMPMVPLSGIPVGGPLVVQTPPVPAPPRNVAIGGGTVEHGNRVLPSAGGDGFFHKLFGG